LRFLSLAMFHLKALYVHRLMYYRLGMYCKAETMTMLPTGIQKVSCHLHNLELV
jgi:hypothetical protein